MPLSPEKDLILEELTSRDPAIQAAGRRRLEGFGLDALKRLKLRGRRFRGADLSGADLRYASFEEADLRDVNFRGAWFSGTSFKNANLQGADLRGVRLKTANFAGADLTDANIVGVPLGGTNIFRAASLKGISLRGANLREMYLVGRISGSFSGSMVSSSYEERHEPFDLSGYDLRGVDLSLARLHGVNLNGANLRGAILTCTTIGPAIGQRRGVWGGGGAPRTPSTMIGTDLRDVDFTGAMFTGVDLTDALYDREALSRAIKIERRWISKRRKR
jgi:uncharacterized protein YjbI with pentapeptide repeats